jgi:hypothetical protein
MRLKLFSGHWVIVSLYADISNDMNEGSYG